MPKADPEYEQEYDFDYYASELQDKSADLQMMIADSKWIVDLVAFAAVFMGIATTCILLIGRAYHDGLNFRLAAGIIATVLLANALLTPATKSVEMAADMILIKLRKTLRIPPRFEHHNIVSFSLWRAFVKMVHLTAVWGTSLLAAEMIKNGGLP